MILIGLIYQKCLTIAKTIKWLTAVTKEKKNWRVKSTDISVNS